LARHVFSRQLLVRDRRTDGQEPNEDELLGRPQLENVYFIDVGQMRESNGRGQLPIIS